MKNKFFIAFTFLYIFTNCQTSVILPDQDRKYVKEIPILNPEKDKLFDYSLLAIQKFSNKYNYTTTIKLQQKDIGKLLADIEMKTNLYYVDNLHNQNFANRLWFSMIIDINNNIIKIICDEFYANYQISYNVKYSYLRRKPVVSKNDFNNIFATLDSLCDDIQKLIIELK